MMHPDSELKYINDVVGYGVFAKALIPEGSITYVKDSLEIEISPEDYERHSSVMQDVIEKYSYIDQKGNRIISWDFAKYVNHCCNCNSMSTGYGFEIALRDIQPGEQITDEYGLFNVKQDINLVCDQPHCRKKLKEDDFDNLYPEWDAKVKKSLAKFNTVYQPLRPFLDMDTAADLESFFQSEDNYKTVYNLKHHETNHISVTN
jgi:hypothetical protein